MPNECALKPAEFYQSIKHLTPTGLAKRLQIGQSNMRYSLDEHRANPNVLQIVRAVKRYWSNSDHGLLHSKQVLDRAVAISKNCPNMLRESRKKGLHPFQALQLTTWAAILHDICRFTVYDSLEEHQLVGAHLARLCFIEEEHDHLVNCLKEMILRHDYICGFASGQQLPMVFMTNPLAEIFRLADKTSLSPSDEIRRYYATGKRYGQKRFFKPELSLETRFQFTHGIENWDYLNYFLLFFAIQPADWYFGETRELYRLWQEKCCGGKSQAAAVILELAGKEGLSGDEIYEMTKVLDAFFREFHLPNYVN